MSNERWVPVNFPWDTLRATIGGTSAIDVPRLHIQTEQEASDFLANYGFHCQLHTHRNELEYLRSEAITFIEEILLVDEPELRIPPEIREQRDTRQLLLWASQHEQKFLQLWSCSLLRVMHTIAHGPSYFDERFGEQIRSQILARFEPHLQETTDGITLGQGKHAIPLHLFHIKKAKPKDSVIMKLLHKPENVAADIFDHIGLRFVTLDRLDALLVVKYLRSHNVFMFANVKPSRSRNTLIDLDWLREETERIQQEHLGTELTAQQIQELRTLVELMPYPLSPDFSNNPYSSRRYHSIQFTCRQMIRIKNPYHVEPSGALTSTVEDRHFFQEERETSSNDEEIRFFFPFEIQITDQKSYEQSRQGEAAHNLYKQRQRQAVKQRILGPLLHNDRG